MSAERETARCGDESWMEGRRERVRQGEFECKIVLTRVREKKRKKKRERRRRRGGEKRDTHGETKIEKEGERDRKALSSPRPSAESFRGARARRDDECDEGEAGGRRCKQEDADDG